MQIRWEGTVNALTAQSACAPARARAHALYSIGHGAGAGSRGLGLSPPSALAQLGKLLTALRLELLIANENGSSHLIGLL